LAATWPVRRVRFRPGHATELVVVSNAEQVSVVDGGSGATTPSEVMPCAGEVVQIWDVRRENIPKWSIPTAMSDGSVSGKSYSLSLTHDEPMSFRYYLE
jgi:hypothetical protein